MMNNWLPSPLCRCKSPYSHLGEQQEYERENRFSVVCLENIGYSCNINAQGKNCENVELHQAKWGHSYADIFPRVIEYFNNTVILFFTE